MAALGAWAGHNSLERSIEGICDRDDKPHKAGATSRCQEGEQKAQSEQPINHIENVINNLRYSCDSSPSFNFSISLHNFVDGLCAKLLGNSLNALLLGRGTPCGLSGDICLHFGLEL